MEKSGRDKLLEALSEPDSPVTEKMANNFGVIQEYYCLFINKFFFKPWWNMKGIEFRPFRNVRIHKKYKNLTVHKIGYFKEWLLNPAYTYQVYSGGQPCDGSTNSTSTFVTFQCGIDNRIISFKETKKCLYYELIFETSFNCKPDTKMIVKNELAMQVNGPEDYHFLNLFYVIVLVFSIGVIILAMLKKTRLYQ